MEEGGEGTERQGRGESGRKMEGVEEVKVKKGRAEQERIEVRG